MKLYAVPLAIPLFLFIFGGGVIQSQVNPGVYPDTECYSASPAYACEGDHAVNRSQKAADASKPSGDEDTSKDDKDHDKGHGNDDDRFDEGNPGRGHIHTPGHKH